MTKKTKPTTAVEPREETPNEMAARLYPLPGHDSAIARSGAARAAAERDKQYAPVVAELDRLRARPATGRKPSTARDAKSKLVRDVCARLSLTRAELAERLDVQQSYLSPSRTLPKRAMEMLLEMAKESGK